MIVITSVPAVVRDPKLDSELAARVAVTAPSVSSAMSFSAEILGVSPTSRATVAEVATTFVASVTNAAVT